jgi:glycosyltransferase involved in cell wall biosynthesis
MKLYATEARFVAGQPGRAEVTVAMTVYNYGQYVEEALDSVRAQELAALDLVVVDDCSTDDSLAVVTDWLGRHAGRFGSARLLRHRENQGLAATRNAAFAEAASEFVFALDPDNVLYPRCTARCLQAIRDTGADFAYPIIEVFGRRADLMSFDPWDVERLRRMNYIDAMALVRRASWEAVGGYSSVRYEGEEIMGWEDYDLWCKFVEHGFTGVRVPEILARYRDHSTSMLRTETDVKVQRLMLEMQRRHPWLDLPFEDGAQ